MILIMVDDFSEIYAKVVSSTDYVQFKEKHKGYVLAHGFVQLNKKFEVEKPWQLGFYSKENDNLAIFETNPVKHLSFDEAFKDGGTIDELKFDPKTFKSTKDVLEIAKINLNEKHKGELVMNVIMILQSINSKPVYNMTFITQTFSMITMHVDALSGDIIKETKSSILDLKKQEV